MVSHYCPFPELDEAVEDGVAVELAVVLVAGTDAGGSILGKTGKMEFPKWESWGIKNPKLVILACESTCFAFLIPGENIISPMPADVYIR